MTTSPVTPQTGHHVVELLHRIQGEYREMPSLCLTLEQMQRLWGVERFVCEALIEALVAAHVLHCTARGTYVAVQSGQ